MTPLALIILLVSIAAVLLIAEMLLPAHGVLGLAGVGALVGAIIVCYQMSHALGLYVALGLTVAAPVAGAVWVKLWPKTPIGRRLILGPTQSTREADAGAPSAVRVGQVGVVAAELRPNGLCDFGGERLSARSERGVLPAGRRVQV